MDIEQPLQEFISEFRTSIDNNTFAKLSLGNYQGKEENLKNIYIKKILIKKEEKLSFTYRYRTRDIVKNYGFEETVRLVGDLLDGEFHVATLITQFFELHFEVSKNSKISLKKKQVELEKIPALEHDKAKKRLIQPRDKAYLTDLNITDQQGNVYKNAQDKYRQINHYVELLSPMLKEIPRDKPLNVVDMGSGKGYLTFALYDYLKNVLQLDTRVTGVEYRPDLVQLCNQIAQNAGFSNLTFKEGSIDQYDSAGTDVLIALHACDTATDDAIYKGIMAGSDLIVVAPCCHKQVRREIEKHKTINDLSFLTRHGIFLERQAEMVTDGIRALILEYFGYKTKVFEFISDAHTPKNVMIVGTKDVRNSIDKSAVLKKIKETKEYFGIGYHHLEKISGI